MARQVYTRNGKKVLLADQPVAPPGGEGAVYRVLSGYTRPDCCVKLYHPAKLTDARLRKLEFMIRNQPASLLASNHIICWPIEVVYDSHQKFAGFVMLLAFAGSEKLYELTTLRIRPALLPLWQKFDRSGQHAHRARLMMCVNIAIAIHAIHQVNKYTIVDYKPHNLLITPSGKVSLTDIDSIQIADAGLVLHHAEVMTPEYAPPECRALIPGTCYIPDTWDRFSLAVSFYELLFGLHPFVATAGPPFVQANQITEKIQAGLFVHGTNRRILTMIPDQHDDFNLLPQPIRNLFMLAFENGARNPISRPTAEQWGRIISHELEHIQPSSVPKPFSVAPIPPTKSAGRHPGTTAGNPVNVGRFQAPPHRQSSSPSTKKYAGWFILAFFGLVLTYNYLNRKTLPAVIPEQDTLADVALPVVTSTAPVHKPFWTPKPSRRVKQKTVPVERRPPCETQEADVLVSNGTDHVLTLYLSLYSVKTASWGPWMEFPEIPPHAREQAITNAAGTRILTANRYRYYAEYSEGGGKYSKQLPRVVSQCDDVFLAEL